MYGWGNEWKRHTYFLSLSRYPFVINANAYKVGFFIRITIALSADCILLCVRSSCIFGCCTRRVLGQFQLNKVVGVSAAIVIQLHWDVKRRLVFGVEEQCNLKKDFQIHYWIFGDDLHAETYLFIKFFVKYLM